MDPKHSSTRSARGPRALAAAILATIVMAIVAMAITSTSRRRPAGGAADADNSKPTPAEATTTPTPVRLPDGRFRGPDGVSFAPPAGWRLDKGSSRQLWGTLRPADSRTRLPEIGIGSILSQSSEIGDTMDALDEIFEEILPEVSSKVRSDGKDRVSTGTGKVGDLDLAQVRWMRAFENRVVVAWGLFEPNFPDAEALVKTVIDSASFDG